MEKQIVKAQRPPTTFVTLPDNSAELSKRIAKLNITKLEEEKEHKAEVEKKLRELSNRIWYVAIHEVNEQLRKKYRKAINEQSEELTKKYHSIPVRMTINRRFKIGDKTVEKNLLNLIAWVVEHYNTSQTINASQATLILANIQAKHGDLRLEDVAICFRDNVGEKVFSIEPALFDRWLSEYKRILGNMRLKRAANKRAAQKFTGERSSEALKNAVRGINTAK